MSYSLSKTVAVPSTVSSLSDAYFDGFERIEGSEKALLERAGVQLSGNPQCTFFLKTNSARFGRVTIQNIGVDNIYVLGAGPGPERCNIVVRAYGNRANVIMPSIGGPYNFNDIFLRDNEQTVLIGPGATAVGATIELAGAGRTLLIGDDCMFSSNVNIRNHDMHTIFDVKDGKILNGDPVDIVIERHVWIGYGAVVFSAPVIGSGSIVAALSFVNKPVAPLTLVGGTPARPLRSGVSWSRPIGKIRPHDLQLVDEIANSLDAAAFIDPVQPRSEE